MRIVFMGTPAFAVPTLEALAARAGEPGAGWELVAVVCQPDRPVGRGGGVRPPAVKLAAERLGIPVYQPERIRRPEAIAWLTALRPDVLVVVAFGQMLPPAVFEPPRWGAVNAHASLLPAYRGAAPIQWAIANGETRTGVTTMRINAGLDTGDMLSRREIEIPPDMTAPELSARLAALSGALVIETLAALEMGSASPEPQPEGSLPSAPLLSRRDAEAEWALPALKIYNRWRGFQPWPGLHTYFRGKQLAILSCRLDRDEEHGKERPAPGTLILRGGDEPAVVCGSGRLILTEVRMEGRKAVRGADFARGAHPRWGEEKLGLGERL